MSATVFDSQRTHVQDFPVLQPLPTQGLREVGPFILLHHAGPTTRPKGFDRGIEAHPHRGFQTLSVVLQGHLAHRDSWGNYGEVGPGGVQWMTAGSGLVHEEMPGKRLIEEGGEFELMQLWVNLPAEHKMTDPKYTNLEGHQIPEVQKDGTTFRVVAGELFGTQAVTDTYSPLWAIDVQPGGQAVEIPVPEGFQVGVYVNRGEVLLDGEAVCKGQLWVGSHRAEAFTLQGDSSSHALIIGGEPLREPVAQYGPFVMNKHQELEQAVVDFQMGKMGQL